MGDRLSIASCSWSMHEPCVGLQYFRLRPVRLRLINLVQFSFNIMHKLFKVGFKLLHDITLKHLPEMSRSSPKIYYSGGFISQVSAAFICNARYKERMFHPFTWSIHCNLRRSTNKTCNILTNKKFCMIILISDEKLYLQY